MFFLKAELMPEVDSILIVLGWAEGGRATGWAEEVGPPKAEEVGLRMGRRGRAMLGRR